MQLDFNFLNGRWIGKLVGAVIGWRTGGPFGVVLGVLIGQQFDAWLLRRRRPAAEDVPEVFFRTTFTVMGHLAKIDGRVSESEIAMAESIMARMQITGASRQQAIAWFRAGKDPDFHLDVALEDLRSACGNRSALIYRFVELQVEAMLADGSARPEERRLLWDICSALGVSRVDLAHIEAAVHGRAQRVGGTQSVADALRVLGLEPGADPAAIKKAYRRLMNRHHPDKLAARGLPEALMEDARRKTQSVQAAYASLKERGLLR